MNEFRVKYPELPELPASLSLETRSVEAAEQSAAATQQATQVAERSLTNAERSMWVSGGLGLATLVIAGVTGWYAQRALSTWRTQMFGEHQYGSAMTALKALREIRVLIVERRSPLVTTLKPPSPVVIKRTASKDALMTQLQNRAVTNGNQAINLEGQQRHYDFAVALNGQRNALEQALVGLEHQWGAEFTTLVTAATTRIEDFANASSVKEELFKKSAASTLLAVQQARTSETERTDVEHRALLWLSVPAINAPDPSSELTRLLQTQEEILQPITQLEKWLGAKLAELTGSTKAT